MKEYLICYFWWKEELNGNRSGFGNRGIEMEPEEDIYTADGIEKLVEYIVEKNNFTGCVILNIIPLHG